MRYFFIFLTLLPCTALLKAQDDTEFQKGFIMHTKLHNGIVSNFTTSPDLYAGGIQLVPQMTIIEYKLRVGLVAGGFYTNKKIQLAAGPTISYKIKTFNTGIFGSAGNINLLAEHLWGTGKQRLIGGGLNADILNKLIISLTVYRDYNLNTWWFQNGIGIRISKKKKIEEPFN